MEVSKHILSERLVEAVLSIVDFHNLNEEEEIQINGINYKFFDIKLCTKHFA